MPVFDLAALTKYAIRIAFVFALVAYIASLLNILSNIIISFWSTLANNINNFSDLFNGGGGGALSCTFYILSELGITEAFASFSIAVISLLVLWATTYIHFLIIRFTLSMKTLFLEATK